MPQRTAFINTFIGFSSIIHIVPNTHRLSPNTEHKQTYISHLINLYLHTTLNIMNSSCKHEFLINFTCCIHTSYPYVCRELERVDYN